MDNITKDHIAPCGMNCRLCYAYQREKRACKGCRGSDEFKPAHCISCRIKNCDRLSDANWDDCSGCEKKCARIKDLDKRYRSKYGMSMLENLYYIKEKGMDDFLLLENVLRRCHACGNIICIHRSLCPECSAKI